MCCTASTLFINSFVWWIFTAEDFCKTLHLSMTTSPMLNPNPGKRVAVNNALTPLDRVLTCMLVFLSSIQWRERQSSGKAGTERTAERRRYTRRIAQSRQASLHNPPLWNAVEPLPPIYRVLRLFVFSRHTTFYIECISPTVCSFISFLFPVDLLRTWQIRGKPFPRRKLFAATEPINQQRFISSESTWYAAY